MAPNQTANGSSGAQGTITDGDFERRLGQLAKEWRTHHGDDLELRHKTGKFLNERFGNPGTRQPRDAGVLKQAAEKLQTPLSTLSRMRSFAGHFTSVQDMKKSHPEVTTWTAVRKLLTTLSPRTQKKGSSPNGAAISPKPKKGKSPKLEKVKQDLAGLSSDIKEVLPNLTEDQKKDLLPMFKELAKALEDCLRIHLSVEDKPVDMA